MYKDPYLQSTQRRIVTAAFGLFFLAIAVVIVFVADASNTLGATIAALVVGVLGLDAVLAAIRRRRSLLERIGPMP